MRGQVISVAQRRGKSMYCIVVVKTIAWLSVFDVPILIPIFYSVCIEQVRNVKAVDHRYSSK